MTSATATVLNALCLFVVFEVFALASNLLNLLIVNIVNSDDMICQIVMVVVITINDLNQMVVVAIDVVDNGSVMLVMNIILADDGINCVEVLFDVSIDNWLVNLEVAVNALWNRWWLIAAVVRWRQVQIGKVDIAICSSSLGWLISWRWRWR